MLSFVTGFASPFAHWCERVAVALIARSIGPTTILHADTPAELMLGLLRSNASNAVVTSSSPGGRLRAVLLSSGLNFIVVLDDPQQALADLVLGMGMALPAALRSVASGCAAMADLSCAPSALVLRAETAIKDLSGTVASIASHLGIALSAGESDAIVAAAGHSRPAAEDARKWWSQLSSAERIMAEGAIGAYLQDDEQLRSLSWTTGLFWSPDKPGVPVTCPIDITGRARCLLEGPLIILPQGTWDLAFQLAFSSSATDYDFLLEVAAGHTIASSTVRPAQEGACEYHLKIVIDETVDHPLTVRISNRRAAFDGTVGLLGLTLIPMPQG